MHGHAQISNGVRVGSAFYYKHMQDNRVQTGQHVAYSLPNICCQVFGESATSLLPLRALGVHLCA